ncbi:Acyl transferase domain-containing protein [Nitrosospira multiformis ATCC 25196]|uniref:Phenolphthiocerol/phthiocerol polyketide synthase subunit E n=1 Tax=Nitrosospira multiformis (strain ATCC 25196 / NCIMB 11849 / C 71) TaxID=323848 RepID=Q2Y7Z3_NITMU|nr:type I polyketide synthase [Nitrosospira multiformis]ABB75128.1 Beta-ketoacyl synthase [Nitrosospira multiformis ATCC 25196]SEG15779.1 Acyl transferase domain-containing protein [Nitrosospira multiformis ATCC 25196]
MDHTEEFSERDDIDIAIIGMAGRFPGADNVDTFWRNLQDGVESVTFFTDEELLARGISRKTLEDPHYIKAGAELPGVDLFDASFFGYTPREAAETDPQHRLFLEVAWQALEDAGYDASNCRVPVGVYAGCGVNTYLLLNLFSSGRFSDMHDISSLQGLMNGNNKDSMTTTVSYKLNLRGPGITVQTACSTSLAAVHVACRGLLNHEADMAMAGGVWVNLLHEGGYRYQPGAILSPDGHCRAFDTNAAGTVIGSGVGIVVLKRLADALADGDTIHAVIKGSAINNDGSAKVGYTAPSVEGQAEVILAAQAIAGVDADTISYVETHGTGTTIGDPIEIAALTQAFRESTDKRGFCAIGSVKTNVGHLDAAAGVAGLIKTVLAMKHRTLPPSLNFEQPNPQIDFSSSPFYVNTESRHWSNESAPRRAGVSSFGIGGTNVHVVLEEAPPVEPVSSSRACQLLTLSARTRTALDAMIAGLHEHLRAHPGLPLADAAYTLQTGRKGFACRAVVLCHDRNEALGVLERKPADRFVTGQVASENRPIVFLFPGQGAQHIDMAWELYHGEAVFRREFDRCVELLQPHLNFDLRTALYPNLDPNLEGGDEARKKELSARLEQTEVTQPALFAVEYALAQLWMSWGIQPAAMIGHSVGEYVAACLAGIFSLKDALRLVALRGRLLQQTETGAMLAVMLPEAEITPYLSESCDLAAVNGPELCVLSGPVAAIEALETDLRNKGVEARRLHVSHAFHSAQVEPMLPAFMELISAMELHPPQIPFLSNLSGDWITSQEATDPGYWRQHVRGTVRFDDGLRELLGNPNRILLEVGPGETLTTLARRHSEAKPEHLILSSLPHPGRANQSQAHFYLCLGRLWLAGVDIDWRSFYADERRRRVSLPTYPFERQSYWIKPGNQKTAKTAKAVGEEDRPRLMAGLEPGARRQVRDNAGPVVRPLDEWFYTPSWRRSDSIEQESILLDQGRSFILFADDHPFGVALTGHLLTLGIKPIVVSAGPAFYRQDKDHYVVRPGERQDYDLLLRNIDEDGRTLGHIFHLWSLTGNGGGRIYRESQVENQVEIEARNFFSLFYLAQALESAKQVIPSEAKVEIMVITDQFEDVTGSESLRPEKALLLGPCKVIPQEYAYLSCRLVDIELPAGDGTAKNRLVHQIVAESQAEPVSSMVAYRGPHRWIQTFEPIQCGKPGKAHLRLRNGGVYLITGGLGGIGLTLAEHLTRNYRAKLVLMGRSLLPAREQWSNVISAAEKADRTRSKIEKVMHLEALGAEVLVLQADVAIQAELKTAVTQAYEHFGAIHGVIHSAGEVGTDLISVKNGGEVAKVFAPKVQGTQALQAVFRDASLDFMLLCSSLAAIAGGLSKVDYCAANAYLDAVARGATRSAHSGFTFPVISVNWDGWRDVGMAANMAMPEGMGISPREGAEAFEHIVNNVVRPQVIVSTLDLHARLNQTQEDLVTLVGEPFALAENGQHEQGGQPHYPRPALDTAFVAPESDLEKSIAEIWQSLLGMDAVGIHDNLFELGGDSLLGIQLLSRVRAVFGIDMRPADFFRSPTVAGLAELVETKLLDEIECL